jgi:hypothetical protein
MVWASILHPHRFRKIAGGEILSLVHNILALLPLHKTVSRSPVCGHIFQPLHYLAVR